MADHAVDFNVLFGLLALQTGLIDHSALVGAFQAWTRDRERSLADHLCDRGALDADRRMAVGALMAVHLKQNGDDPRKSLASIAIGGSTREALEQISDAEVEASLDLATVAPSVTATAEVVAGSGGSKTTLGTTSSEGQRFRVLRPHAQGGLGAVFVAIDSELHREVALKEIQPRHADDPGSRARFLAEAEITGGLEHPGIVPVYGLGAYGNGRPFYAMRFIKGDSLKDAITRFHDPVGSAVRTESSPKTVRTADPTGSRELELRKLLRRFLDVCNAIDYAHSRGVLHRDIKPGNIMVGTHGETLVVDWGLAKVVGQAGPIDPTGEKPLAPSAASGSAETLPGSVVGTPAFMSPEQAAGDLEALGAATDVYSLGATLYCLLTGRAPFEGDTASVIERVRRGQFAPPRALDPTIDRALEAICLMAMALKPADRYASPRALADDVERWMADEPVSAFREGLPARLGRWGRRHRTLVVGTAAALGVLLVVLGASTVLLSQANERTRQQERIARQHEQVARQHEQVARQNLRESSRVVAGMLDKVVEKLPDLKAMDATQKEILESALTFYTGFVLERGREPELRLEVSRASMRLGDIHNRLDRPKEAEDAYRQALTLLEGLVAETPNQRTYHRPLASALGGLGRLYESTNRPDQAEAMLKRALGLLEELEAASPTDDAARDALARAAFGLALFHDHFNKLAEARPLYERAAAIQDELASRHPDDPGYRADLAKTLYELGYLIDRQGRLDLAVPMYERLVAIQERLVEQRPANAHDKNDLCGSLSYLGAMYSRSGRHGEAEAAMRRAIAIQEQLVEDHPDINNYAINLAKNLGNLGNHYTRMARHELAERTHLRALKLFESLAARAPEMIDYAHSAALTLMNVGVDRKGMGDLAGALAWLDRADGALEALRRKAPNFTRALQILSVSAGYRAEVLDMLGRFDEALAVLDRADTLGAGREEREHRQAQRALTLAHRGAFAEALALAPDEPTNISDSAYIRGAVRALAARAANDPVASERLARAAVAHLARAHDLGHFKFPASRTLLDTAPDLDPLRTRPDFRALQLDVAMPADPFVP